MSHVAVSAPPSDGWTGGQGALVRMVLGAAVGVSLVGASPLPGGGLVDVPGLSVDLLAALGGVGALLVFVGAFDRLVALLLLAPVVGLLGPAPAMALGIGLIVHALRPSAALLSLTRRGQADPRAGFRAQPWLVGLASLGYAGADVFALRGAVEGDFGRAALGALLLVMLMLRRTASTPRPGLIVWLISLGIGVASLCVAGQGLHVPALLAIHLAGASPLWWPPRAPEGEPLLLYDGECGLCHGAVRLALSEDVAGVVAVAPLAGTTCASRLTAEQRAGLPDSLVWLTSGGELATRSDAVAGLLISLGGLWRLLGVGLRWLPRPLRDGGYDLVARVRSRVFARPGAACPLLPRDLVGRVLP